MPTQLIDPVLEGLARALDVHQRRHEVLASNLANLEMPGFRAQEVDFGTALARAFDRAAHAESARPAPAVEDETAPARADGNTVDLDLHMAKLSDNADRSLALSILGQRIAVMRLAIDGGK